MTLATHYVSVQDRTLTVVLKQQEHVHTYTKTSHAIAVTMDNSMEGVLCPYIASTRILHAQMIAEVS